MFVFLGIDKVRCKYFEVGVLPLDEKLERMYYQEHGIFSNKSKPIKTNIKCKRCNTYFDVKSNRQLYCESCKKIVKREQAKISMRTKRNGA